MTNAEKFKTADERARALTKWCAGKQKTAIGKVAKHECSDCPLDEHAPCCFFFWLDLEAEDEKQLPCPFCGSTDVVIQDVGGFELACQGCGFHTPSYMVLEKLTSEYQRVARAVMEAGKKEVTP